MKSQIWNSKILNFGSWLFLITGMVVGSYLLTSESSNENSTEVTQLRQVSAEPASTIDSSVGHIPIEDIKVGMRILARNPEISDGERATWTEPNWADYYHLSLVMPKPDGSKLHIEMLRSEEWVRSQLSYSVQLAERAGSDSPSFASCGSWSDTRPSYVLRPLFQDIYSTSALLETAGANIGNLAIQLDLPELGLSGEARVLKIRPNGQVNSGTGEVVTATFHHTSGDVIDLAIVHPDGSKETVGTTANHPFWSVDRQEFIPADELGKNENLTTYSDENQTVDGNTSRGMAEVYNLEVNNEHVYFVGANGTLVHNAYPVQTRRGIRWKDEVTGRWVSKQSLTAPKSVGRFPAEPDDFTRILGAQPKKISTTQHGTRRYLWEPNSNTRIRFESHPGDSGPFAPRHHGEHYHVEIKPDHVSWNQAKKKGLIKKVKPEHYAPGHGTGFLPDELFPGG